MEVPNPTYIYRLVHFANLSILFTRGGLHAPNHAPDDGLKYRTIHNVDIQKNRRVREIPCGPGGVIHDYVSFYFCTRSPMLFQLHTGYVQGYYEGQEPIIYLVTTAQAIEEAGLGFVFSDGHGIATFTHWFDDLTKLDNVHWDVIRAQIWKDTSEQPDRQRRKQAEFLIHKYCDWSLIKGIGVVNQKIKGQVDQLMEDFPETLHRPVKIIKKWYY